MADNELDAFLGADKEPVPEAPPPEQPAPEQEQDAPDTAPEHDESDDAPPEPRPGERTVPLAVLEKTRKDHKERAARLEGELAELRRQFEEAKRAPQPPPQQYQPQQPIDPVQDPAGYHAQVQQIMLNERLNMSEMQLRRDLGPEAVDAAIAEFKGAMAKDPSLQAKLYQQPDPYAWMAKQVEVMRFQKEVGEDPAAYKARLRQEWEAEQAAAPPPPPVSPAARLNPSLANVRSAAPRATGDWAGPTPLDDILRR